MIEYRVKLVDYLQAQKEIADNFFAAAAAAEEACENATHTATTNSEQNAAQAVFKSQFQIANQERAVALEALGPPPVMPLGCEFNGTPHETHKFEPYGCEQDLFTE